MRLKKIKIFGFKSFADRTELEFHPGITGIVGPNGCGKSNISDAFRWVFGEQSAKSMRGGKMQDVIFSGTSERRGSNFCEVTIVLDEIEGALPIEFEEISITRKLYRSGESEYFLNGRLVRLKDIYSLLLDSGLGKDAYSIFEQGKIDQIIQYTPQERRSIFEEAAGVTRFLQRKKEAGKRLDEVSLNVNRVQDIFEEVDSQIQKLESQAGKASIFKEKKAELEKGEKGLLLRRGVEIISKIEERKRKKEELQEKVEEHTSWKTLVDQKLFDLKERQEALEKEKEEKKKNLYEKKTSKEISLKEELMVQEKISEKKQESERKEKEIHFLISDQQGKEKEKENVAKDYLAIEALLKNKKEEKEQKTEAMVLQEKEYEEVRKKRQKEQEALWEKGKKEKEAELLLSKNKSFLEENLRKLEDLRRKGLHLEGELIHLGKREEEKKAEWQAFSESIDLLRKDFQGKEEALKVNQTALNTLLQEINQIERFLSEKEGRYQSLLRLKKESEGFSQGAKKLLQETKKKESELYGKIFSLQEILFQEGQFGKKEAYALNFYKETLVVHTKKDLEILLHKSEKEGIRDFSVLCLEAAELSTSDLFTFFLDKVVFIEDKNIENIFEAFHQQAALTVIGKNTFLNDKKVLFEVKEGSSESNPFLREKELLELVEEMDLKKKEHALKKEEYQKKEALRQDCIKEKNELDRTIRQKEMKFVEVNFSLQKLKEEKEKNIQSLNFTEQEQKRLSAFLEEEKKKNGDLQAKFIEVKKEREEVEKRLTLFAGEIQQKETSYQAVKKDLEQFLMAFHKEELQEKEMQKKLHIFEMQKEEARVLDQRLKKEIEENKILITTLLEKQKEFATLLQEKEKALAHALEICEKGEEALSKVKLEREEIEKEMKGLREAETLKDKELYQLNYQEANDMKAFQEIQEAVKEKYEEEWENFIERNPFFAEKTLSEWDKKVKTLRNEIEALGDVNMTSIEEFESHKNRHQFLHMQLVDLTSSKEEIEKIILSLEEEAKSLFLETFEKIRVNFQKNFAILFRGGEADLSLVDHKDPLSAGVELLAKPPGKAMRSIHLLSGGEKCLTAVALLFAIFEVKPSPFCILDEIDAPLDDTNVERFLNVVKEFSKDCQFIIITHNKKTMSLSDILFGVAMEERGVSKVLSIDFARKTVKEEASGKREEALQEV